MRFSKFAGALTAALLALVTTSVSYSQPSRVTDHPSASALFDAIKADDSAAVARIVKADPKLLKTKDEDEWLPLHVAAFGGYERAAKALVAAGAPLESRDPDGERPAHLAASNGKTAVLKLLLEKKAAVDPKNDEGETPLFEAADNGKADAVELLLDHGADVNVHNHEGLSPFMAAARSGYLPVVELLHRSTTQPQATTRDPMTDVDTVKSSDFFGYTPLHFAVENGKTDVVQYLLTHGVHPVGRTRNGNLPIHLAATWHSNDSIIDLLISYAAFVDSRNRYQQTPMHLAVWEDRPTIVAKLLEKHANPNIRDSAGSTPLILAAHAGRAELVNLLLDHGADPNIATNAGETPMMLAVHGGYVTVASVLLEHKANLAAKDSAGHTFLYYLEPDSAPQIITVLQDEAIKQIPAADREKAARFFEDIVQPNVARAIRNLSR